MTAFESGNKDKAVAQFTGSRNQAYYAQAFHAIGESRHFVWTVNRAALLLGPIWFGFRGLWQWMLAFTILETFALILIGRGLWADLTQSVGARIASIEIQLDLRKEQLETALAEGSNSVAALRRNIEGLEGIIAQAQSEMLEIEAGRFGLFLTGLALFLGARLIMSVLANPLLARSFASWRATRQRPQLSPFGRLAVAVAFVLGIHAVNYSFYVFALDVPFIKSFPTTADIRAYAVDAIEDAFDFLTIHGDGFFDAISFGIRVVLDALETVFVETPWMVVAAFVIGVTALSANVRSAVIAAVFLAYIGSVGLWVLAMQTLALLGTAACISISLGIPLGIYSARRPRFYRVIRPILDMQQTMPTFVYMIPVIAFFGTGKAAAVVTCLIFGMPPVVRLTVLGIQGVPASIREAAVAYGSSEWYLMTRVELPLAAPSIRAGINQTILLSLLTVVVASLIGAKGLGEDVLEALQYASIGQGLLAGLAILFLAKILDRIFMGKNDGV
ncbi:ABC transporter permease subunit [Aestuariivita sp.]|jgi:glycine betaine/proline transport system permease protein|uniref:ABC transporter permease n=1 Tax=Aestuariivita sp. TaxID=1872407 RepID=UPI0021702E94|nr:ABC transporter permease subunit [Aestuariivita sp.]MCE8007000.1 ABC transporter permease subunit [Aestuariivita sp.]